MVGIHVHEVFNFIQCFIQNSIFSSECSGCSLTGIKLTGSCLSPLLFVVVTIFSCGHFLNRCKSRLLLNFIQVGGAIVSSISSGFIVILICHCSCCLCNVFPFLGCYCGFAVA